MWQEGGLVSAFFSEISNFLKVPSLDFILWLFPVDYDVIGGSNKNS